MTTGERIRFFRKQRGMTQRKLGEAVGFSASTADVRIAQYETGERTPKPALLKQFADVLGVSAYALTPNELDTLDGIMHTLFALEDHCGFRIAETEAGPVLRLPPSPWCDALQRPLAAWARRWRAVEDGCYSKEEYDRWRGQFTTEGG